MKSAITAFLFLVSSQAMALSNADLCGQKVQGIARQIRSSSIPAASVKSSSFMDQVIGVQQLDGIYEVTFDNDAVAEIRLDMFCSVLEYRMK
jgi:hypothetical protein